MGMKKYKHSSFSNSQDCVSGALCQTIIPVEALDPMLVKSFACKSYEGSPAPRHDFLPHLIRPGSQHNIQKRTRERLQASAASRLEPLRRQPIPRQIKTENRTSAWIIAKSPIHAQRFAGCQNTSPTQPRRGMIKTCAAKPIGRHQQTVFFHRK